VLYVEVNKLVSYRSSTTV